MSIDLHSFGKTTTLSPKPLITLTHRVSVQIWSFVGFLALCMLLTSCGESSTDQSDNAKAPSSVSTSANLTSVTYLNEQLTKFPAVGRARAQATIDAIAADPDNAKTLGAFAMLAHANSLDSVALGYYELAAQLSPNTFEWHYLPAVVLAERGDTNDALASLRSAQAINDTYPPLRLRVAELLIKGEQPDEARTQLDAILVANPAYPEAHRLAGQLALDQQRTDDAIRHLKLAVASVPHYGSAHFALSNAYRAANQPELAKAHQELFTKHQRGGPVSADKLLSRVEDLRQSAQQMIVKAGRLSAQGKLREAAEVFEALLQNEPNNAVAHINLIGLYGETGRIGEATSIYQAGLKLIPNNVTLHSNYGVLMIKQQRYQPAVAAMTRAIELDPERGASYKYLAISQQQLGKDNDALANFQIAYKKDPTDHQAGYFVADMLADKGRLDESIMVFNRITAVNNAKTAHYLLAMARTYFRQNDQPQGMSTLERARTIANQFNQKDVINEIELELSRISDATSEEPR